MYLVMRLSARSSSTFLPESVSSRLTERNFFKGILKGSNEESDEERKDPAVTHVLLSVFIVNREEPV